MTPFDAKLPPGWTAAPVAFTPDTYVIRDESDTFVAACYIDKLITLSNHLKYIWQEYGKRHAAEIARTDALDNETNWGRNS